MVNRLAQLVNRFRIALRSRAQGLWLRCCGVDMRGSCWLGGIEVPRGHAAITLEACALDRGVTLLVSDVKPGQRQIHIERGVYINRNTMIDASQQIRIGAQTMIGPNCYITDHDHGMEADKAVGDQPLVAMATVIGRDVWLGAGVIVLKGVTIGDGAVVAAGAVVTRDVAPRTVVAGVPARVMGERS